MKRKGLLLGLFVVLAMIGCALMLLSGLGDASVIGTTSTITDILEQHGLSDKLELRGDLFGALTRLQEPWAWVSNLGLVTILVSVIGVVATVRSARKTQ